MFKRNVLKIVFSYVFIILLLTACGSEEDSPPAAVLQARSLLAEQINVPVEEIMIVSMEEDGVDRFLLRPGRRGRNMCSRNDIRLESNF